MFALANMVHFFTDKFTRLCAGSFSLPRVTASTFESCFFWHNGSPFLKGYMPSGVVQERGAVSSIASSLL